MGSTNKSYHELYEENQKLVKQLHKLNARLNEKSKSQNYPIINSNIFQLFFEDADLGLSIIDANGNFLECNPMFSEITGYSNDELKQLNYYKLFTSEVLPAGENYFAGDIIKSGDGKVIEQKYANKAGVAFWILLRTNIIRNPKGEKGLIIAVVEDITERKKLKLVEDIILRLNTNFDFYSIDEIIELIIKESTIICDSQFAFFHFVNEENGLLNFYKWFDNNNKKSTNPGHLKTSPISKNGNCQKAISQKKTVIQNKFQEYDNAENLYSDSIRINREMVFPIIDNEKVVAILSLANKSVDYSHIDVKILNLLISSLWSIISRKKIEVQLIESEYNFRAFFNTVDNFLLVLDEKGIILEANQRILNELEYERDQIIGKPVFFLHPDDMLMEAKREFENILKGESTSCFIPLKKANHEIIQVETKVSRGKWNNRDVIFGVTKDLSKLQYSEEKFSKVFHVNPAICAIIDLYTDSFIEVNNTFFQKLKHNKEKVFSSTVTELLNLTDALKSIALNELKETGLISNLEMNLPTSTMHNIPVLLSGETVVLQGKKYLYAVGVDITDKVEADLQLRTSENKLKEAENIAQIGHYSLDLKTGTWESSESLDVIFGIDGHFERNIENWQLLLAPDSKEEMINYFNHWVLRELNNFDKEYRIVAQDTNIEKWVHGRGVLKFDENNELSEMVGTIQDITEKKLNEIKIHKSEYALKLIMQSTTGKGGQDFFDTMSNTLNQLTHADYTFIGELINNNSIRSISLYQKEDKLANFLYLLKGTPCENVIGKQSCVYEDKIKSLFPGDELLIDMGIEAYVGTPIFDHKGTALGILVSLFKKPLTDSFFIQSLFEICASSIGSEIQRFKTELRVQENEKILNVIFDNAPVVMMLLDENADVVKINRTGQNLSDYSSISFFEKKPGAAMNCIFHLDNNEGCGFATACSECIIMNTFKNTLETGEYSYKVESELITRQNGAEFKYTFLVSSSRLERNGKHLVLLSLDDITERKIMEHRISESELMLNKIFEHAPLIMMLFNQKAEVIKVNKSSFPENNTNIASGVPSCKSILSCAAGQSNNADKKIGFCNNCVINNTIESTLKTGKEVLKKEVDIISLFNSEIMLKTYLLSSSILDKSKDKKVLITLDDITERKSIEEELLLSKEKSIYNEKRYRLLSNLTFEGIMLYQNRKIIDANRSLCKMCGYSYSELIGQDSMNFLFPAEFERFFEEKMAEDFSLPYETVIIKKNGSRFPVEIESRYFKQNNQRIRVAAIRDLTERKLVEKKILQAIIQTEENERARFAQELHDGLGPILSNVQMYFEWLAEADANKQFVFEKGNISLNNAFVTLREISNNLSPHILHNFGLLQAINNFIDSIALHNITIDLDTNIENTRFSPDIEISLYRVVTELINNSLKYSSANKIALKILLKANILSLNYSDNGKGFNFKEINKNSKGYGMININNRIKTIQGKLIIKSQPNNGITVEIFVNLKQRSM